MTESEEQRGAASVYWAKMTRVKNGRLAAAVSNLLDITILTFLPDAWPEPRYLILVGREGTDDAVGVCVARTRRRARRELAEVEAILATSTEAEARAALDLNLDLYGPLPGEPAHRHKRSVA